MRRKILHLEKEAYATSSLKKLADKHSVTYASFDDQNTFDIYLQGKDFDVVFTKLGIYLGKKQIDALQDLKIICTPTTGYNHIDVDHALSKGIQIIGLKDYKDFLRQVKSTAEHTWSLLLSIARNLHPAIENTRNSCIWDRKPYLADELDTKTLGIIGYGRLGKIVADYGRVFGMQVLVNDLDEAAYLGKPEDVIQSSLTDLLQKSDYIVLLISWSKENINFIDASKLSLLKKSAYFINTSRGELIDEKALLESLSAARIKGAALDVLSDDSSWDTEKTVSNSLLTYSKENNNLIITPHMGGYGKDSIEKTRTFITNLFLNQKI